MTKIDPTFIGPMPASSKKSAKAAKKVKAKATVSSTARSMILKGKTNKQVWSTLKLLYKLDDTKKHYPAWYRSELRRKGQLAETTNEAVQIAA